ncbi:MAG: regulatory protein RecX [Thermomicrobium sp.]
MEETLETITQIAPDPRRTDRFRIERNGVAWLTLSAARVAELGLRVGEVLTAERRVAIEHAATVDAALEVGLRLLSVRPRSEAELQQRLRQKRFSEAVIQEVLARLRLLGYVDDRAFAEAWVAQRQATNPRGAAALRQELRSKGVSPELIKEVVLEDPESELAAARELVRKHKQRLQRVDAKTARRRLTGLLQRRGFSWSVIHAVLREHGMDGESAEELSDDA